MSEAGRFAYVDEIKSIVCSGFDIEPATFSAETPFDEIGLDSRKRVQLLAMVEVHFRISVGIDELDRLVDLNGVADVIVAAAQARA